jgi:transposase
MVAALAPMGEILLKPFLLSHSYDDLEKLGNQILGFGENTRVVMEATGRYHEPVAKALHSMGIYVCILNPLVIKQSGAGSVRKVKTDKKDALKIAKYGLDNWTALREYCFMDNVRQQLKLFSRQYNLYMKTATALQNNLISLLDKTFPGINDLFTSACRDDGHQKWVDFVMEFWHCETVTSNGRGAVSLKAFSLRYQKWCKRMGYHFSAAKAAEVYAHSKSVFPTLPKSDAAKLLVQEAVKGLISAMQTRAAVKAEVIRFAKLLPEFDTVTAMYGVGEITAAGLMAELGDVRQFANRGSIVAFAGIDPEVSESGNRSRKSNKATKRGSPHLRRTLFQVASAYLRLSPHDEPVYRFLDKKRREGKPYYVYMTAAANKFLRIYHARVKECLNTFDADGGDTAR